MAGKQHVFIVGSKGIPASYGGFETFVEKLTQYKKSPRIQYHVAVLSDHTGEYMHNGARCFCVKVPDIGSAKAVYYDGAALDAGIAYCKKHPEIRRPIFYVLACRIGPFIPYYRKQIHALGESSSSIRTATNGSGQNGTPLSGGTGNIPKREWCETRTCWSATAKISKNISGKNMRNTNRRRPLSPTAPRAVLLCWAIKRKPGCTGVRNIM